MGGFLVEGPLVGGPEETPGMWGISLLKRSELGWSGTGFHSLRLLYGHGASAAMEARRSVSYVRAVGKASIHEGGDSFRLNRNLRSLSSE